MDNLLLPVGSIVSIKDYDKLYVVCSADSKDEYEYILAPYPVGITPIPLVRKEKKENIEKVYFSGYLDKVVLFDMMNNGKEGDY